MRLKATTIGFLLVATGLSSFALTFGRVQGAAWIGQPLNLVVPVQVEPGQTAASLCAQADVFHADSKQDSNRVQVAVDPAAQPDTFLVKISSSTLVDEPVVTVYLRTGCDQKNTRRFVLLADFPTEGAAVAPRLAAEALASVPTIAPVESAAPAKASAAATSPATGTRTADPSSAQPVTKVEPKLEAKVAAKPAPETVAKKPVAKPVPAPAPKPVTKAEAPPKPVAAPAPADVPSPVKGPRLKLDPLEVLAERVQSLESTTTAQAPQDQAQDAQRMQQLQNDVKALLEQASKNEANLLLMRQRLEKAESEQVPMGLVYGLVALLALALAGLAAMWSQRKKSAPWQLPAAEASGPVTVAPLVHEDAWHSQPVTVSPDTDTATADKDEQVDVAMIEMDEDLFKAEKASAAPQASPPAHTESRLGHPAFNSDSVLDAIQGAEFFAKLGKTDEAIQSLEKTIRADGKGSALLYLELMRIAHDKSLKTDFRQFRDEFQEIFNVTVPEFALFRDEGKGLEGRPELLEHICRTWATHNVLEVLESCILREPFDKSPKPFDLAAFRELVLLHGIALHHATQAKAKPAREEEHVIDFEL